MADDKNVTTRTRAEADDRAAKAWRLRVMGAPWAVIARELGYANEANVHRAVRNYFGTVPQIDRDMMREMARQRGEQLWMRAYAEVERTGGAPAAIRAATEVLRRHAALDGLDEPTRVDLQHTPSQEEFVTFVHAAAKGLGIEMAQEADIFAEEYNVIDAEVVEDGSPA
jgi:AraC-like DNA-binding protein